MAIIPWIGGKRRLADVLIPRFPPHTFTLRCLLVRLHCFSCGRRLTSRCSTTRMMIMFCTTFRRPRESLPRCAASS